MKILTTPFYLPNKDVINRKQDKKSSPIFGQSKLSLEKTETVSDSDFEKVKIIAEKYQEVFEFFSKLNGIYTKKIKSLYPNIDATRKAKGFVFSSGFGADEYNLQISKQNSKLNNDNKKELITFNLLDKDSNDTLIKYQYNADGSVVISSNEKSLKKLSQNPFEQKINYSKYLNTFYNEMFKFTFFAEHSKEISKQVENSDDNIFSVIQRCFERKNSTGMKKTIIELVNLYNDVSQNLGIGLIHDATELKSSYFEHSDKLNTKGFTVKSHKGDAFYNITPLRRNYDNAVLKISVYDKKEDLKNIFILFDDGKIAKQKIVSPLSGYLKTQNLEALSDKEIKSYKLDNICSLFKSELSKFNDYISEERNKKKIKQNNWKNRVLHVEKRQVKPKSSAVTEPKSTVVSKSKRNNKIQVAKNIEEIKKDNEIEKNIKSPVVGNVSTVLENNEVKTNTYLNIRSAITAIENIFKTPVEQRSCHLVHEKLSNGKIFEGRFRFKAEDGAEIVVSRVKSPRYVEFVYYSISIKKDGKETIVNFDPEYNKIIKSVNGKPIIFEGVKILHVSKYEFVKENPLAKNLNDYLKEITKYQSGQKAKVINYQSIKTKKQDTIQKYEKEILKLLENCEDSIEYKE